MHSKYPAALTLQARVMYHLGDADAAIAYQLKALAYFEQLEGLDSSQVWKIIDNPSASRGKYIFLIIGGKREGESRAQSELGMCLLTMLMPHFSVTPARRSRT